MSAVRSGRALLVESVIAGTVVGAIEAVLTAGLGGPDACDVRSLAVVAALAGLGATAASAALNLGLGVLRVGPLARWAADLRAGGARRTLAAWHAAMLTSGALVFAVATFLIAARIHNAFRELAGATVAVVTT
jgi:hypothetical protein